MSILALQKKEILQLLKDYNLTDYVDEVKEWYDGYLFGNIEIYNPWSTLIYYAHFYKKSTKFIKIYNSRLLFFPS